MTTVACNRRMMAADSRFHEAGVSFPCKKIYRIGESIFGLCGETRGEGKFLEWIQAGKPENERPDFMGEMDDFAAIELNESGIYYWDKHLYGVQVLLDHFAIGSGGDFARVFMSQGMDPEQAVREVCERDLDYASAGPVQTEVL